MMSETSEPTPPGVAGAENFESTLKQLEALVERMEHGDLSLEDSLQAFEQGIKLSREAQTALEGAEQRVRMLTETASGTVTEAFDTAAGNNP
jgi:exodeoxyribonuclease VII small subunit